MNTEIIREKARSSLNAALESWNLNADAVYINGVNNLTERLVISSRSLTEEAVQRILEKDEPSYSFRATGLFSAAYSFADEHRVNGPDAETLSGIVTKLVRTLG